MIHDTVVLRNKLDRQDSQDLKQDLNQESDSLASWQLYAYLMIPTFDTKLIICHNKQHQPSLLLFLLLLLFFFSSLLFLFFSLFSLVNSITILHHTVPHPQSFVHPSRLRYIRCTPSFGASEQSFAQYAIPISIHCSLVYCHDTWLGHCPECDRVRSNSKLC